MLSSNACVVSLLIEKRSSTFPYPSNWASLVRKDAPKGHRPSRRVHASKTTPVREKKRGWTRRRGNERPKAVSIQPFSQSGVRSRARGRLDGRGISREKDQAFSRCNEEFSWRKRQKRRDFYPVLRRFFFVVVRGWFFSKRCFLEREDLNASMKGLT